MSLYKRLGLSESFQGIIDRSEYESFKGLQSRVQECMGGLD